MVKSVTMVTEVGANPTGRSPMLQIRSYNDFPIAFTSEAALNELLTAAEKEHLDGLKTHKRQREWLLGRMTSKDLIARYARENWDVHLNAGQIEILPNEDGAPEVAITGPQADAVKPLSLSLSHRGGLAVAAVESKRAGRSFGVDIERVDPRRPSFIADYFTQDEQKRLQIADPQTQDRMVTVYWCVKEAVLKAVGKGLSVAADRVSVRRMQVDGAISVACDSALTKATVTVRCWHLPQFVLTWASVDDNSDEAGDVPQAPFPAQSWVAIDLDQPDALLSSPKLTIVAS
jgi:phosphopantetheinyl transferase